jgi:hypothetical protein
LRSSLEVLAVDDEVEGRAAVDEDLAVAVEDVAPGGGDRDAADTVLDRGLVELLVLDDLEHPEPYAEDEEDHEREVLDDRQPRVEVLAFVVES